MLEIRSIAHFQRWKIFEPEHSIHQIFQESSKIQQLCREGFLCWSSVNDLVASEKGLNVIDAILPNVLNELDGYFAGLNSEKTSYE